MRVPDPRGGPIRRHDDSLAPAPKLTAAPRSPILAAVMQASSQHVAPPYARATCVVLLAGALVSCGMGSSTHLENPEREHVSFVYGYLDLEDAPTSLGWLDLERVAPRSDDRFYHMRIDEGVFYGEFIDPGSYVLSGFGGGGTMFSQRTVYNVSLQQTPFKLIVDKPGVYFVGSWKYRDVETGMFEAAKYDLEETAKPTALEVIERILPHAKGTTWDAYLHRYAESLR
jgi:hypothetical protein